MKKAEEFTIVGRPINGISINGLEYLKNEENTDYMYFKDKEEAKVFLRENAFPDSTDEELEDYYRFERTTKEFYEIIHEEILMFDDPSESDPVVLHCSHTNKVVKYITISKSGVSRRWEATKHPEDLTADERYRILEYRLGSNFDKDEIVNYTDLFMQSEFIKEIK